MASVSESVVHVHRLNSLKSGIWPTFRIECVGRDHEPRIVTPREPIYPFLTVQDLKRILWMEHDGEPCWAPDRVFLGVRYIVEMEENAESKMEYRPLDFHWPSTIGVELPDPIPASNRIPNPKMVDAEGQRFPNVRHRHTPDMTLEAALAPELSINPDSIPAIVAISLAAIQPESDDSDGDGDGDGDSNGNGDVDASLFGGFYQLYFPRLKEPEEVGAVDTSTKSLNSLYATTLLYMQDRIGRIDLVESKLAEGGDVGMTLTSAVRIRWSFPAPDVKPESLERVFYELRTSKTMPFLRFFPANGGAPLLKLGIHDSGPDAGHPFITNEAVLRSWLHQSISLGNQSRLVARLPLSTTSVVAAEAFNLSMYEDGSCDIRIEVSQQGHIFRTSVINNAERVLGDLVVELGFPADTVPVLRDIAATYTWTHPNPKDASPLTPARLRTRIGALRPFLELPTESVIGGGHGPTPPLVTCVWRAVSNFDSDGAQFAFIADQIREDIQHQTLQDAVSERFGMSIEDANRVVERWLLRSGEAMAPAAGAGALAVAAHSEGAIIKLFGSHPSYSVEIQGLCSWSELHQIVSVVGVLLGARDLTIVPPAAPIVAVEAAVTAAATAAAASTEAAVDDEDEVDPDMMALIMGMGGMGGMGDGGEEEEGEEGEEGSGEEGSGEEESGEEESGEESSDVSPPEPADAECRGNPWLPTEPPIVISRSFHLDRLQALDANMFKYPQTPGHPLYSKSCQHSGGRQPNAMNAAEYARVKRCYEGRVRFVNLPPQSPDDLAGFPDYKSGGKTKKSGNKLSDKAMFLTDAKTGLPIWTVYGYESKTQPGLWLYLMCTEYWCVRDNIPLVPSEFKGTVGRGFTKKPFTCAFCGGRVFTSDISSTGKSVTTRTGESVIRRIASTSKSTDMSTGDSSDGIPLFIGRLKKQIHPKGYDFTPCCDLDPKTLREYLDARDAGTLTFASEKANIDVAAATTTEIATTAETATKGRSPIDFIQILSNMTTQYILSSDKPLQPGKIGLTGQSLDRFFGQNSNRILETLARPSFIMGAAAFVRVGVDISTIGYNFYSALAPFMGLTTAIEVRNRLLKHITVREFESANYGTLLLEFAAESDKSIAELTPGLALFAAENKYTLTPQNRAHLLRLFGAWTAFRSYMTDPVKPKKLRHFEHILAYPGIFTHGLLIVTLEQEGDRTIVACPSFGIPTASMFEDVRVVFMSHNSRYNIWEPLVFHTGLKTAVRFFSNSPRDMSSIPSKFRNSIATWIRDWRNSARGCGRPAPPPHVWTPSQETITGLPRLSQFVDNEALAAIVRDRSNRLAGVLFKTAMKHIVFIPCLDDGNLAVRVKREYEFAAIPQTPLDICLKFYREELIAKFKGLTPTEAIMHNAQVFGFRTMVGTIVPTGPSTVGPADGAGLRVNTEDVFPPWEQDAMIFGPGFESGFGRNKGQVPTASIYEQHNEAYQHVRITLARKLKQHPGLRSNVLALIENKALPLFEKRKRMDILLEPRVKLWLFPEETDERVQLSILRTDCLSTPESDCEGGCRWSSEKNRCLIHAPSSPGSDTNSVSIFSARLSDELLRYPFKRREILEDHVPSIRPPRGVVRVGDELFAEARDADSLLERLGFFIERSTLTFPEEMIELDSTTVEPASDDDDSAVVVPAAESGPYIPAKPLPPSWTSLGFIVPIPAKHIRSDDARSLAFASGTRRDLSQWERLVQKRRTMLGLPGPAGRPLQWSTQDWLAIADINYANLLFFDIMNDALRIYRWIQPPSSTVSHLDKQGYMMFWGPDRLLITRNIPFYNYKFSFADLPAEVQALLPTINPIPEKIARGFVDMENADIPELEEQGSGSVSGSGPNVGYDSDMVD